LIERARHKEEMERKLEDLQGSHLKSAISMVDETSVLLTKQRKDVDEKEEEWKAKKS
jgi:hypothetical protein